MELVIPIADYLDVPPEPPVNIPTLPEMKTLGNVSNLAEELGTHIEDTQCLGWHHGTVQEIVNEKTNRMRKNWDAEILGENDVKITNQKLVLRNWNPKKVKKGGWREYLTKKYSIFFSAII